MIFNLRILFSAAILCLLLLQFGYAQNILDYNLDNSNYKPYKTNWQIEAPILILSSGLTISQMILKDKSLLNPEYVASLDRNKVNSFDRGATFNYSRRAKRASDYLLYGSMSAPMLLLADQKIRRDWKNVALVSTETFLVGMGITMLAKNLAHRPRPFLYNQNIPIEDRISADGVNSFFSGHTSMTALSTFMMAKILVDYHPNTKLKPLIWTAATAIPLSTGMLRFGAGKHFLSDVFTGFAVGAFTGYIIPHIHYKVKNRYNKRNNFTTDYFGNKINTKELFTETLEF